MSTFMKRLVWLTLWFGIGLMALLPIGLTYATSIVVWLFKGIWNGFDAHYALRVFKTGLFLTPLSSVLFTIYEYGQGRGWWR